MARPAFFRDTIWIDVLAFGPFYAFAIYAFIRGRDWIRVPALVWSGVMMANVTMILFEERYGEFATSHFGMVLGANLPWFLFPVAVIVRMWRDQPFTRAPRPTAAAPPAGPAAAAATGHCVTRTGTGRGRVVAGASEGIGAAFADRARPRRPERRARRPAAEPLARWHAGYGRPWRRNADGGRRSGHGRGRRRSRRRVPDIEVGLVVANAAYAPIGPFLDLDAADLRRPSSSTAHAARLARHYLPPMVERGRGGLIVMSSLAGQQGSPGIATYAATKAFGAILAEGLWAEMRRTGVDVLACVAGAVQTPGLAPASRGALPARSAPDVVARPRWTRSVAGPRTVPGRLMKVSRR